MNFDTTLVYDPDGVPKAFQPPKEVPYVFEKEDSLLPSQGFLTDFVYATKGTETPTLFCLWSGIWCLSAALSRMAYMHYLEIDKLWPNLYILLVAPPSRCKKSTGARYARAILEGLPTYWKDARDATATMNDMVFRFMKTPNMVTNKTTPEAVFQMLAPQETIASQDNKSKVIKKGSQLSICISEFATFMNKKKYNQGLVDTLTDLFDCPTKEVVNTISRGPEPVENVYITLIGATTPDGLKESLPAEAHGTGFMSRVVTVYQEKSPRRYSMPTVFDGFPKYQDLVYRLGFTTSWAHGEFSMSPGARQFYDKWYDKWRADLDDDDSFADRMGEFRMDNLLLKLAMLLRISEYRPGFEIEESNFRDALRLLNYTYSSSSSTTKSIGNTQWQDWYTRAKTFAGRWKNFNRRKMQQYLSPIGCRAGEVTELLQQLISEGFVSAWDSTGKQQFRASADGRETYKVEVTNGPA
jgi:hypothetical protein